MNESWWIHPDWSACLNASGLTDFESAWQACVQPEDEVNRRAGGWGAVHRVAVADAPGGSEAIYLKQQHNFRTRNVRRPWRDEPVAARERHNLLAFAGDGLPVPQLVCFGEQERDGQPCALLATAELTGYRPLDEYLATCESPPAFRAAVIHDVGELIGRLHARGWEFRCLYPKHVFVRVNADGNPELSFIDLEKARRRVRVRYGATRDLASFINRCPDWSPEDWACFAAAYRGAWPEPRHAEQVLQRARQRIAARHTPS